MDNVKKVATGANYSFVLKTDNTFWGFGWGYRGLLGISENAYTTPTLLSLP